MMAHDEHNEARTSPLRGGKTTKVDWKRVAVFGGVVPLVFLIGISLLSFFGQGYGYGGMMGPGMMEGRGGSYAMSDGYGGVQAKAEEMGFFALYHQECRCRLFFVLSGSRLGL